MNTLQTRDIISHVVDINPVRQGRYVPKSAQLMKGETPWEVWKLAAPTGKPV